jgi:esterase/lipase
MARKEEVKNLVKLFCAWDEREAHQTVGSFIRNELLREMKRIKKKGIKKYKKEYDELKQALDAWDEHVKRLMDMTEKAENEVKSRFNYGDDDDMAEEEDGDDEETIDKQFKIFFGLD